MRFNNILETIGNTYCIRLNNIFPKNFEVWMKIEKSNPGGSIKDRIALAMIEDAERKGILKPDTLIVEPTSGNTGIGLAMVCSVKKYKLIIVMPEAMSIERRKIMEAFGAQIILTPRQLGMKGAIEKAEEIVKTNQNAWMPSQFTNNANVEIHKKTTAQEIINDFPEGIDYLVTGVGTGGHITGVGEILKSKFKNLKIIAVEPFDSPVLSGGKPAPHTIQGIGAGFIPEILNTKIIDEIITITKEEAYDFTKKLAKEEGILAGISTGASCAAINKIINKISKNSKILTFNYDTGERYLSIENLF